jgi:hypothetical protein
MVNKKQHHGEAITQLVDLYAMEEQLYGLLLRLTEVQLETLKNHATADQFVSLAEKKDHILRSIERVDRCLRPVKARWMEQADALPQPGRDRLNSVLDSILAHIDSIAVNEQASQELLAQWDGRRTARIARHPMKSLQESAARIRAAVESQAT